MIDRAAFLINLIACGEAGRLYRKTSGFKIQFLDDHKFFETDLIQKKSDFLMEIKGLIL